MADPNPTEGMITIRHVAGTTRPAYNRIYAGAGIRHSDRFSDRVLELLSARPGMRLLDVACGEAQLLRRAAERGLEAHGVDLSDVALRVGLDAERALSEGAPQRGDPGVGEPPRGRPLGLAVANGERLPYPDGHFDLVTNMGSLEHYEDPIVGAAEMARVIAPGGKVALHVPNTFGLRWAVMHAWRHGEVHDDGQPIQRYGTRDQWTRLLAAGGLEVEQVIGYEDMSHWQGGLGGLVDALRHPSRLLVPLSRWLPADMASMLLFVCRRADDGPRAVASRGASIDTEAGVLGGGGAGWDRAGGSTPVADLASTTGGHELDAEVDGDDPGDGELATLIDPTEVAALEGGERSPRRHVRLPFQAAEFAFWHEKISVQRERRGEVLLVVQRDDGDVLLHTKDHYPDGGWRLLSGGVRHGEEVLEALVRELHEETGVRGADYRYLGLLSYDLSHGRRHVPFASYLFHVHIGDAEPKVTDPDEAISGFRWVAPEALDSVAEQLREVETAWRDWGAFRAVGHEWAKKRLAEGL